MPGRHLCGRPQAPAITRSCALHVASAPHACLIADYEEIAFCEIASPSRFPSLYELSNALPLAASEADRIDDSDTSDDGFGDGGDDDIREEVEVPPGSELSFLYTGQGDSVAEAAMGSLVRQPNFTALLNSASSSVDLQVG